MPPSLTDEEIDDIIEEYQDVGNVEVVAENLGHSDKTVRKYVNRWKGNDDDGAEEEAEDEGFISEQSTSSQFSRDPAQEAADDFRDFLEELDEEMEFGFKERFVRMKTLEVRRTAQLPNPGTLANELKQYPSGVGNNEEIKWIANLYGEWLNNRQRQGQSQGPIDTPGVPIQDNQSQQPAPNQGGVPVGGQQPGMGQQPQPEWQGGQQRQQPQQGQQGQMAMMMDMMESMMSNQQNQEVEALKEEIRELKEDQSGGGQGAGSLVEELQELAAARETLEQITGGGQEQSDAEQLAQHFQQQIQQLQQQVAESNEGSFGDLGQLDEGTAVLSLLAQQGADADTLAQLADKVGSVDSDPEVAKKEVEREMKELELEQQEEKWDAIMEGVSQAVGNIGGILQMGDEAAQNGQAQQQTQQQEQQREQQQATLQPVPDQEDASPARQRAERMVAEAPEQPQEEAHPEPHTDPQEKPEQEPHPEQPPADPDPEPPVEEGDEDVPKEEPQPAAPPAGEGE